jgi:hypothetical protein
MVKNENEDAEKLQMKETEMEDEEKAMDEEEDSDSKKKKKKSEDEEDVEKGEGETPEQSAADSNTEGQTASPGAGVPSRQNVAHGQSSVPSNMNASNGSMGGQSPSEVSYSKSGQPDMTKSPLYVQLSKQIGSMEQAVLKKFASVEQTVNARIDNMMKELAKAEDNLKKFYGNGLHKAASDNNAPESTDAPADRKSEKKEKQYRF